MLDFIRKIYARLVPEDFRYLFYRLRNNSQFQQLRTSEFQHSKAIFSLKEFDQRQAIFVHITKSAGTSVALSLFGALPSHYTAVQYRVIFGRKDFDRYFKFAFVRNPWDRLYSAYNYLKNGGWDENDRLWTQVNWSEVESFEQFVVEWLSPERLHSHLHLKPQYEFLVDWRGRILVDYIGYFETINEDFSLIAEKINPSAQLGHTNASPRQGYVSAYTLEAREKVADLYRMDISLFGYDFDRVHKKVVVAGRMVGS